MTSQPYRMPLVLANFVLSQAGWLACVLTAAAGKPLWGCAFAALVVLWHLFFSPHRAGELRLLVLVVLVGGLWDSLLVQAGLLRYPSGIWLAHAAPYWILALWALFATTLNVSLRWLHGRPALAAACGAIAGPLSFTAGARLGGVVFDDAVFTPLVLAFGWAVLMPAMAWLAVRCEPRAQLPAVPRDLAPGSEAAGNTGADTGANPNQPVFLASTQVAVTSAKVFPNA